MSSELAGLELRDPEQTNWEKFNSQSGYQAPPPAEGEDGKRIVYKGIIPKELKFEADQDGYLQVLMDNLVIQAPNGPYTLRFTRASVKPFQRGGKAQNKHSMGKLLRAAGSTAKPQTNDQYVAAVKALAGRPVNLTIDWKARNGDTGETIKGYRAFPIDPERGTHKAILHAGDTFNVIDNKGTITGQGTVSSEVLFANGVHKSFVEVGKAAQS